MGTAGESGSNAHCWSHQFSWPLLDDSFNGEHCRTIDSVGPFQRTSVVLRPHTYIFHIILFLLVDFWLSIATTVSRLLRHFCCRHCICIQVINYRPFFKKMLVHFNNIVEGYKAHDIRSEMIQDYISTVCPIYVARMHRSPWMCRRRRGMGGILYKAEYTGMPPHAPDSAIRLKIPSIH